MVNNAESSAKGAAVQPLSRGNNPSDGTVQRTRAWTGLWVVVAGDVAIAAAAIFGIWKTAGSSNSNSPLVAILTSAFTAIGTMTTAYFGIKTMSNTAQSFAGAVHTAVSKANPPSPGGSDGTGVTKVGGGGPHPAGSAQTSGVGAAEDTAAVGDLSPDDAAQTSGPPIPKDPQNPTDAEIVARTAEPGEQGQ
jgi:hypothetical protein